MTVNATLTEEDIERLKDGEVIKVESMTLSTVSLAMVCDDGEHNWGRYSVQGHNGDGKVRLKRRCSKCHESQTARVTGDTLFR
jgi:hypothetical protein